MQINSVQQSYSRQNYNNKQAKPAFGAGTVRGEKGISRLLGRYIGQPELAEGRHNDASNLFDLIRVILEKLSQDKNTQPISRVFNDPLNGDVLKFKRNGFSHEISVAENDRGVYKAGYTCQTHNGVVLADVSARVNVAREKDAANALGKKKNELYPPI